MSKKETQAQVIKVPEGATDLTIRYGEGKRVINPRNGIEVSGVLSVPKQRIAHLPNEVRTSADEHGDTKFNNSYVMVNRAEGWISFIEDAGMENENKFTGYLAVHPKFKEFGINTDKSYTTHELADFIKMNRTFFETRDIALNLISELRNFKAKVDKQMEHFENQRGDKRFLMAQAVESNIPETFNLNIPIFKGEEYQTIEVEVSINAVDFSCKLISPEAADFMECIKDELINEQLDLIQELEPQIAIFEQ